MSSLADLRRDYTLNGLRKADLHSDPIEQFRLWLEGAVGAGIADANAMVLSTADSRGVPSSRVVLLKDLDARGFIFFSNYDSPKGKDLGVNPRAALLFFWPALERQVRIAGAAEKTSRDEADRYFHSRPRESQLSAIVSRQGEPVAGREALERMQAEAEEQFEGKEIPLPPFWGGYCVKPESVEFWQGRSGRLHDRLRYRRKEGGWVIERLSP